MPLTSTTRSMVLAAVLALAAMAGSRASFAANEIPQIIDVVTTPLPGGTSSIHARLRAVAGTWELHLKQLMHRHAVPTTATSVTTDSVARQGDPVRGDLPITPCSSGWFDAPPAQASSAGASPNAC